jgi:hypothetical protein
MPKAKQQQWGRGDKRHRRWQRGMGKEEEEEEDSTNTTSTCNKL